MRVAVVGGGVSGLTAALALAPQADVSLFEKESRLGGHAHTHTIDVHGQPISVDTGFMVFNPPRYPEFVTLLEHLGIESVPTSMSFSVSIPGKIEFSSVFPRGVFADRANIAKPRFLSFLLEISRFNRLARKHLHTGIDPETTLGSFILEHSFSERLQEWYLYPMLAAIWSCASQRVGDFPALATFRFLENHNLLSVSPSATWRTIPGGSIRYVQAIESRLRGYKSKIILNANIAAVTRDKDAVCVVADDKAEYFDHVIFATHADTALALLADASSTERDILGSFSYSENTAILHSDTGLMPARQAAWASWNYIGTNDSDELSVTYDMNSLQHIPRETPVYVSLNPVRDVREECVLARMEYSHPHFDVKSLKAQMRLNEIQNINRTLYAGAHWGYGFHEDGVASGLAAARALHISPPWRR